MLCLMRGNRALSVYCSSSHIIEPTDVCAYRDASVHAGLHSFTHSSTYWGRTLVGHTRQHHLTYWSKLSVNGFIMCGGPRSFQAHQPNFGEKSLPVSYNDPFGMLPSLKILRRDSNEIFLWSQKWLGRRLTAAFNFTRRFLTFINKPHLLFAQTLLILR